MGSAQSYIPSELVGTALTGLVIASAVGIGFTRLSNSSTHLKTDEGTSADSAIKKGKKKKQNKAPAGATSGVTSTEPPQVVYLPNTIPGQFEVNPRHVTQDSSAAENLLPKTKKPKKKKNKNTEDTAKNLPIPPDYHSESSVQMVPKSRDTKRSSPPEVTADPMISSRSLHIATSPLDTDSSWTQVGTKRSRKTSALRPSGESQSEASFTTSQKDEASPRNTAEDDSHDSFLLQQSMLPSSSWDSQNRKSVAEKLLPDPRKTGVEDMLETPDCPKPSRVIRVTPLPNEKPVAGFSWADYEDVRVATDGGENDADGEDDGWGVVTSKRPRKLNVSSSTSSHPSSQPFKAPETLTKRQRQNAQRREQQKAAKVEAETQRLATLAGHTRELEKARMHELLGKASSSKPSGGMKATVDQRGNLIWE